MLLTASRPVWTCEFKFLRSVLYRYRHQSHPVRVREFKFVKLRCVLRIVSHALRGRVNLNTYSDILNEITDYIRNVLKVIYREIYWIVERDIKK